MRQQRRFARMYEQYADDIFRFIFVRVNDSALAEDLTADTFAKAWQKIEDFDFKNSRAWLYTIARNTLTDHWRKRRPVLLDEDMQLVDEEAPAMEERMNNMLEGKRLHTALADLPEQMRSIVTMRFILGYSVRKTAKSLELSEANVRTIQFRALKKLRGILA